MTESNERRLALTRELFTSLSSVSNEAKQDFAVFMNQFRLGAKTNYLSLPGASKYERIILKSGLQVALRREGELHLLLNVGSAEAIEAWAKRFKCEVNPTTGAVQIYEVSDGTPAVGSDALEAEKGSGEAEAGDDAKPLFEALSDEALSEIGLPGERLSQVRRLKTAAELEALQPQLPDAVYEALTWYVQGEAWTDIVAAYSEAAADEKAMVPTAIGKLDSARFRIIETDEELRSIMEKPLAQWRVFLHPTQQKIVDAPWHGAVKITGGAGTGKTVAALHRARHLVRLPDWKTDDRLFFTTFTRNLALDLEQQLRQICTKEEMRRIRVQNIDAWLAGFVRQHGADKTIVYPNFGEESVYETCWREAWASFTPPQTFDAPESFCRSEWEEVILPQHCRTLRDYLFAERKGRGVPLSRKQRKELWPLFEDMRLELNLRDAMTVEDAAAYAVGEIQKSHPNGLFRAVIADETQDLTPDMLKLLRAIATDVTKLDPPIEGDLFLVGDPHQRIYGRPVAFSSCGIEIRGRSRKLRVNYRTTDEIRKTADAVYQSCSIDDLDGSEAAPAGYASLRHGAKPVIYHAETFAEEIDWIADTIQSLKASGYAQEEICVTVRTNARLAAYARALSQKGLVIQPISRSRADDASVPGVRIATMHRIKGLEFKVVFVSGMEEGVFPQEPPQKADRIEIEQTRAKERALFYVAASRASNLLFLTASGRGGTFFERSARNRFVSVIGKLEG